MTIAVITMVYFRRLESQRWSQNQFESAQQREECAREIERFQSLRLGGNQFDRCGWLSKGYLRMESEKSTAHTASK